LRVQFKTDGSQIAPNVRCATVKYKLSWTSFLFY
jgi:hypothetical protein